MKIQYVSIKPTEKANELGCLALTPELLAATGARYSRNNEGLDAIASKIDHSNLNKSVDGIFKMIDYGHQSIADMTPIALFIDEISQFAAYYLWTLSPTAGGQECSTRYIKMDISGLVDAETLGIPEHLKESFDAYNKKAFESYKSALLYWTELSNLHPEATKIPQSLRDSEAEKDIKAVARMKRNYAFDRARVYIPLAASTGVMMIQSARAWANISAHLQAHHLKELNLIGKHIAEQMSIGAPRLLKHTKPTEAIKNYIDFERQVAVDNIDYSDIMHDNQTQTFFDAEDLMYESVVFTDSCRFRTNRYSPFGSPIARMSVKFAWQGISFGEIRDLNRHRTGTKYCPLIPLGFYGSTDQIPDNNSVNLNLTGHIYGLYNDFKYTTTQSREIMKNHPEYIYFTSSGHKYYFEHTTTADKFLYEMELRTGIGAHYKYAEHCKEALKKWYEKFPETQGIIFEGSAEPE
jgi:thymidylate synthase ThyX